jgi:hypothetical protein
MAKRDYTAEYRRRVARGLAKGLSRSQARGHPRASEAYVSRRQAANQKLEAGVAALRKRKSLSAAAREVKVSPERLRRYLKDLNFVEKQRGRWVVGTDTRLRVVLIYSDSKKQRIVMQGYEPAALTGSYWNAVGDFLRTNDTAHLAPFVGAQIRDANGKPYTLETRPNVLYRLSNEGGDSFEQVYLAAGDKAHECH